MRLSAKVAAPAALALALLLPAPARAQAAPTATDVDAAAEPVMQQLEAFRRDDFDAAYAFASAEIRQRFDRARFEAMVRGGYPEIARSVFAAVAQGDRAPNGNVYLVLKIRGANGVSIEAVYEMVREAGAWKINGVVTKPDPGVSA
ncbi:MAG TPA: DUF4864 domain-containing protein [Methylomirabilota bacterium]|nr:DUF4864 domain-containing protein [Methylomirabilota bacterium]